MKAQSLSMFGAVLLIGAVAAHANEAISASAARSAGKPAAAPKQSAPAKQAKKEEKDEAKTLTGMSILGNQEAPKALVIVPWKSSQLGDELGINKTLDDSRQPVDKDVFMRELAYYEIRSNTK